MNANGTIRSMLKREGISAESASIKMGRLKAYISALLSKKSDPKSTTLVQFSEAMGYEVIVRSKDDGFEFFIDE